jgi:hypothetical protein
MRPSPYQPTPNVAPETKYCHSEESRRGDEESLGLPCETASLILIHQNHTRNKVS